MNQAISYRIFKNGSVTFFAASLLFPKQTKQDIFNLYAFVRMADDFVDSVPQQPQSFYAFKSEYYAALEHANVTNELSDQSQVIAEFVALQKKYSFEQSWVEAFFKAMESDLSPHEYVTLSETKQYMYGSAEVIGLMMAAIMRLDTASYPYAQKLGQAFQYMNMIRDIAEDLTYGRVYLPSEIYTSFGLTSLSKEEVGAKPEQFAEFIHACIAQYKEWRKEAIEGFPYIPPANLRPIKIALGLFDRTIEKISQNPHIIFEGKIRPSKVEIATTTIKQLIFS